VNTTGRGEGGPPTWIKTANKRVCRVETSGAPNLTGAPVCWIRNPSSRISCCISLSFEPDVQATIGSYTAATYTMRAWRRNLVTGKTSELHTLQPATNLPHAYELDSAVNLVRLVTALAIPTVAGVAVAGDWVLQCEWQPNTPLTDAAAQQLFSECDIELVGDPPVLRP